MVFFRLLELTMRCLRLPVAPLCLVRLLGRQWGEDAMSAEPVRVAALGIGWRSNVLATAVRRSHWDFGNARHLVRV